MQAVHKTLSLLILVLSGVSAQGDNSCPSFFQAKPRVGTRSILEVPAETLVVTRDQYGLQLPVEGLVSDHRYTPDERYFVVRAEVGAKRFGEILLFNPRTGLEVVRLSRAFDLSSFEIDKTSSFLVAYSKTQKKFLVVDLNRIGRAALENPFDAISTVDLGAASPFFNVTKFRAYDAIIPNGIRFFLVTDQGVVVQVDVDNSGKLLKARHSTSKLLVGYRRPGVEFWANRRITIETIDAQLKIQISTLPTETYPKQ